MQFLQKAHGVPPVTSPLEIASTVARTDRIQRTVPIPAGTRPYSPAQNAVGSIPVDLDGSCRLPLRRQCHCPQTSTFG